MSAEHTALSVGEQSSHKLLRPFGSAVDSSLRIPPLPRITVRPIIPDFPQGGRRQPNKRAPQIRR
jgi:hypothetical protein